MGRTRLAEAIVRELWERIKVSKEREQQVKTYLQKLKTKHRLGEISYSKYEEEINRKRNKRNINEWIEHYQQYTQDCEEKIKKQKRIILRNKVRIMFFSFVFVAFLLASIFYIRPVFIGLVIQEQEFTQTLNLNLNESTIYEWQIENPGTLSFVKISGLIEGKGDVKIYLDDLLILTSDQLETTSKGITGQATIESKKQAGIVNYFKKFFGFLGIVGQAVEETSYSEEEEAPKEDSSPSQESPASEKLEEGIDKIDEEISSKTDTSYSEEEEAPKEDSSPSQESPASEKSEKGIEDIKEKTEDTKKESEKRVDKNITGDESIEKTPENITEIEEDFIENESIEKDKKEKPKEEITIKEFTDLCEETCDLENFNLNKSSYTFKIEISSARLKLNEIKYEIIKEFVEEKIPKEIEEEIIENITIPKIITEANATITTVQDLAVIGKPVKWKKHVRLEKPEIVKVYLPKQAKNITVNKISNSDEIIEEVPKEDSSPSLEPSSSETKENAKFSITGKTISKQEKGIIKSSLNFFQNIFSRLTGRVIDIQEQEKVIEVTIEDNANEYEIEYETPAPHTIEEDLETGKRIKIIGPEDIHYKNVLAFTNLSENLNIKNPSRVKIHWIEGNKYVPVQNIQDTNNNGVYDYIEFIAPILSNQTFEIILIIKAEHLDKNRIFISEIYNEVYKLDGVWSETIPNKDYVRVVFEKNLTSKRDITIYPRVVSGTPKIEIYEINGTEIIAEFTSLIDNQYNKVYLANLMGSQDTFDLRIVGGNIEFDHIVDPTDKQYFLIGPDKSGNNGLGTLEETEGANTATWTSTTDGDYYTWIKQYTEAKTFDIQTFTVGFWCYRTGSIGGDRIQVEDLYIYDCGNSADCSSQDGTICSILDQSIDCDVAGATFRTISCTSEAGVSLGANDYLGVRLVSDTADNKASRLILEFNSTTRNSHFNVTETTPDNEYPLFSTYWDNNATLTDSGTGLFNVTLLSTNGTVWLEINNTNITATNITANVYNASHDFTLNGTYSYKWHSWGNGTQHNYNVSEDRSYTVNASDNEYPIFSTYWDNNATLTGSGTGLFNVTLLSTNGTVWLEINNTNITATNITANVYNASHDFTLNGTYSYKWHSWGNGTSHNYNVSSEQSYTINTSEDVTPPTIELATPANNTNTSLTNIVFNWTATDNLDTNLFCNLTINGIVNETSISVTNNTAYNLTVTGFNDGTYSWNVTCWDSVNNSNTSETRNFNITSQITVTETLNPTSVNQYTETNVSVYGHINLSNGNNVSNAAIEIWFNGSLINVTTGWNNISGQSAASSTWWNTSWNYRTKVEIESSVSSTLNNTIALVNFSTTNFISESKMNSDCGDVRFVDSNGTELSHTLETSTCNSSNTIFWVWTNLTGNSNTTVYAYYGNSNANIKTDYTNPDDNLVLYMHFDNSSDYGENDSLVYDFSWTGNNGTCSGASCPTWNSSGKFGGAFEFDGDDDYVDVVDDSSLKITQFTISHWVYSKETASTSEIIQTINKANAAATGSNYVFSWSHTNSDFDKSCAFKDTGGAWQVVDVTDTLNADTWYHIVCTYNGSDLAVYIDGALSLNETKSTTPSTGDFGLSIGSGLDSSNNPTYYFNGTIDEVRIYNRSLSADEILSIYNSTKDYYTANQTLTSTDSDGDYNYTFSVNKSAGNYPVIVNLTYTNLVGNNSQTLTVSAADTTPRITHIFNESMTDLSSGPNEAPISTNVIINFTAYSPAGAGNLNHSSARINFTKTGETTRTNITCTQIPNEASGNYSNYTCSVTMWWWDGTGTWDITAYIEDNESNPAQNTSTDFYIGERTAFVMSPSTLNWTGMGPGATNKTSNNHPIVLNNTGNANTTADNIQINSSNLRGETISTEALWAGNFSVAHFTGGTPPAECNSSATTMNASTYTNITGALLAQGNYTINDGTGQEQLYFCLRLAGTELSDQAYSTANETEGSWVIRILVVLLAVKKTSKLKKRKKKQKTKLITNIAIPSTIFSKGLGCLEATTKYMKENLGMSYHKIAELLNRDDRTIWTAYNKATQKQKGLIKIRETDIFLPISILRNRKLTILKSITVYLKQKGLTYSRIAELLDRDQRNIRAILVVLLAVKKTSKLKKRKKKQKTKLIENITIPSTIFSKDLGCLEATTKYMKENLGMSYHKIAGLLNRDDRTVWTAYNKATQKQKGLIKIRETDVFLPVSIFRNRKLTILKSITIYLKQKGLTYSGIAELLDRDQRNIRAIYSKAINE